MDNNFETIQAANITGQLQPGSEGFQGGDDSLVNGCQAGSRLTGVSKVPASHPRYILVHSALWGAVGGELQNSA